MTSTPRTPSTPTEDDVSIIDTPIAPASERVVQTHIEAEVTRPQVALTRHEPLQQRVLTTARETMPDDRTMKRAGTAAAIAAPFVLRSVAKWRANPKHKKVREHMSTGAVVVREHETVAQAARKLEACEIGALPVGRGGELVGVLTDRDIVTQVIARGLEPNTTFIGDIQFAEPIVISASDSIRDAAELMMRHGVRRLPVIDHERVVGMIAQADIARAVGAQQAGILLEAISEQPPSD